jgi:hypothetical protein
MGDDQGRSVHYPVIEEEDIYVDGPRCVAEGGCTAHIMFYVLDHGEEFVRLKLCADLADEVEKGWLVDVAYGLCLVQG